MKLIVPIVLAALLAAASSSSLAEARYVHHAHSHDGDVEGGHLQHSIAQHVANHAEEAAEDVQNAVENIRFRDVHSSSALGGADWLRHKTLAGMNWLKHKTEDAQAEGNNRAKPTATADNAARRDYGQQQASFGTHEASQAVESVATQLYGSWIASPTTAKPEPEETETAQTNAATPARGGSSYDGVGFGLAACAFAALAGASLEI